MKGRSAFTREELDKIARLLDRVRSSQRTQQKRLRDRLRDKLGFYITDFGAVGPRGFDSNDLERLIREGRIKVRE